MEEITADSTAKAVAPAAAKRPWGTWQELVLVGAVLRLGAADWSAVAAEMRCRFSHPFTPEECKAKYDNVQERFSDLEAWFEALRGQRIKELKKELAKSENSIGCLQLKLAYLMEAAEQREEIVGCNSGRSVSPPYADRSAESTDAPGKVPFYNDRSSAGSFVEDAPVKLEEPLKEKDPPWTVLSCLNGDAAAMPGSLRRKRGARKRRFHGGDGEPLACQDRTFLEGIVDAIAEHGVVSLFHRRLESQKESRYRRMIRRHVDFQTVRSGISDGTISSAREVLRDLLLLCNNALVFFCERSPEHEAALVLRRLVAERLSAEGRGSEKARAMEEFSEEVVLRGREDGRLVNMMSSSKGLKKNRR